MASRYEQREIVIQSLFEADFNSTLNIDTVKANLARDAKEFLLLESVPEFANHLAIGVVLKKEIIDEIIEKAAPEWPMTKISFIDRALLRLGIFELLYGSEYNIPPKVAINESIELSKAFGGDNSRKFVNGVLGGIYKEMQASGVVKDEKHKTDFIIEDLVGACLYKRDEQGLKMGFIIDMFKHVTWPKGHLKEAFDAIESLKQIVLEEACINCVPEKVIGENSYVAESKDKTVKKRVTYYIAQVAAENTFQASEGTIGFIWMNEEEAINAKLYRDMKPLIKKAFDILENRV